MEILHNEKIRLEKIEGKTLTRVLICGTLLCDLPIVKGSNREKYNFTSRK